jgi:hypothetical protein
MSDTDYAELYRRMIRIETRLVLLIEALGFTKDLPRQHDDDCKVVHVINGTKVLK